MVAASWACAHLSLPVCTQLLRESRVQSGRAGYRWGTRPLQIFLHPSFLPFFLIFFLSFFSHLSDSSPSLRNAWNDNALRASSFEFSRKVLEEEDWRKICETGEKVKRCELAERRRFPIYVNFNFPFVLISRYLPFDRSICVINNVTSTSDVTINSGG